MYGMVNRALEQLVVDRFGESIWQRICLESGIGVLSFVGNRQYPDEWTYRLVATTARVVELPMPTVLEIFGEHWVLRTASEGFGDLLDAHGTTFADFILALPNLHTRIVLLMPGMQPPQFAVTPCGPQCVDLAYGSERAGLLPFVVGLVRGLGKRFATPVVVTVRQRREEGHACDLLHLEW